LRFGPPGARAPEIRSEIALEPLLGKWPAMAEQAEAHLPVGDYCAAARGITLGARKRLGNSIVRARPTDPPPHRKGLCPPIHPTPSAVRVLNHASASTASAARDGRGASDGLTPPDPGTSASCPFVGT